eukprot:maker-scaffold428_size174301-snap-gene-0.19 protein:Tk03101 transcript:maker-scaffold428_size174301-snap-gene-0.19-mRNA-1 annotation:"dual specificity protein phosphatase 3"
MSASVHQQRIALRGSDGSIDFFTDLLRKVKLCTGLNSAEVVKEAIKHWRHISPFLSQECSAHIRQGVSRNFHLHLLTSFDLQCRISVELEMLRRDVTLKSILNSQKVNSGEYLLEALILLLQQVQEKHITLAASSHPHSPTGAPPVTIKHTLGRKIKSSRSQSDVIAPTRSPLVRTPSETVVDFQVKKTSLNPISWRQRLRQEQVAEAQRLQDCVRKSSIGFPDQPGRRVGTHDSGVVSVMPNRQVEKWTPVHHSAITGPDKDTVRQEPMKYMAQLAPNPATRLSRVREKFNLDCESIPVQTLKQRQDQADQLMVYLRVQPPESRVVPGYDTALNSGERVHRGVDCDDIFPGIVLGNGATLKKKDYLKGIGITHILNAAEFRGVNISEDFFNKTAPEFSYMGIRIEDTPQTQICRYFVNAAEFIDNALLTPDGKIYVNCVFGKSRSTTCIVAYLMICHDWPAIKALKHLRARRPVEINAGFRTQIADLEFKLNHLRCHHRQNGGLV